MAFTLSSELISVHSIKLENACFNFYSLLQNKFYLRITGINWHLTLFVPAIQCPTLLYIILRFYWSYFLIFSNTGKCLPYKLVLVEFKLVSALFCFQDAVAIVQDISDAEAASRKLIQEAYGRGSSDNITCVVVRFENP